MKSGRRSRLYDRPVQARPRRTPQLLEQVEQAHAIELFQKIGAKVYENTAHLRGAKCRKCGTFVPPNYATGQTKGMSDLVVFLPRRGGPLHLRHLLFCEMKEPGGGEKDLRPEQRELMEFVRECGNVVVSHLVGDFDAVIAWLVENEYVKAESFPHYRQPKGSNA